MTIVNLTYKDVRTAVEDTYVNVNIKGPAADKSFLTPSKFNRLADKFGSFQELVKFAAYKGLIDEPRMNELLSFSLSVTRADVADPQDTFYAEVQKLFFDVANEVDVVSLATGKAVNENTVQQELFTLLVETELPLDYFGKADTQTLSIQPLVVEKEILSETRSMSISTNRDDGKYFASDFLADNNSYVKPSLIVSDTVTFKLN